MWLPESSSSAGRTTVVVCDDSHFMCELVARGLEDGGDVAVLGRAADAQSAIELCRTLRPDVLTLDLTLPDMDGVHVIDELADLPTRVLVVSSATSSAHSDRAVEALTHGAVDVLGKPSEGLGLATFVQQLVERVRDIATGSGRHVQLAPLDACAGSLPVSRRLLVIGASTGGPRALTELLGALPRNFPAPVVVVQHMPPGFSAPLARRLDAACAIRVREATDEAALEPGVALVGVAGRHLHIGHDRVFVRDGERVVGGRPSLDVALRDAASTWGDQVSAVVLTGIGRDGTEGARAVRDAGGRVLVEAESTCAVYGMPRAVAEAGLANLVLPLDEMPPALMRMVGEGDE